MNGRSSALVLVLALAPVAPVLGQDRKGLSQGLDPTSPLGAGRTEGASATPNGATANGTEAPGASPEKRGRAQDSVNRLFGEDGSARPASDDPNAEGLPPLPARTNPASAPAAAPADSPVFAPGAPDTSTPISETPPAQEERKGPPIVVFDPASFGYVYNDRAISGAASSANKTKASTVQHSFSLPTDPKKLAEAIDGAEVVIIHAHGSANGPHDAGYGSVERLTADRISQAKQYLKTPPKLVILLSCENAGTPDGGGKSPAQAFYDLGVGQVLASDQYMNDNRMTHYATQFLETYAATGNVEQAKQAAYADASEAKGDGSIALPEPVAKPEP